MKSNDRAAQTANLEEIMKNNERIRVFMQAIGAERGIEIMTRTQAVMDNKGLPKERFTDILYLGMYAPGIVDEFLEVASKVDYKANQLNMKFEEVIYDSLQKAG